MRREPLGRRSCESDVSLSGMIIHACGMLLIILVAQVRTVYCSIED